MISAVSSPGLSGRFTPMPMGLHIGFCIFATVVFLTIYFRRRSFSALLWTLICDTTLILQFFSDKITALGVGICEAVLFVMLFVTWLKEYRQKKAAEKKDADGGDEPKDDRSDIEKLVKTEMQNIPDNSDDIISNAFEDDRP